MLSGAGGGLVGALASRVSTLEGEISALRGQLSAREREAAQRDKEAAALRRQLENALGEARSAREALAAPRERILAVSGMGTGSGKASPPPGAPAAPPRAAAAAAAAAGAGSPPPAAAAGRGGTASPPSGGDRASPTHLHPPFGATTVGEMSLLREASAKAEAESLRGELGRAVRERNALGERVKALERQARDMVKFLGDYGLEWVGHGGDEGGAGSSSSSSVASGGEGSSAGGEVPPIDFALVLFRLQQLNALAGEGKSRVVSKDGVSRLVAEPLGGRMQLTLYSDGLLLRKGPFRPYGREATRLFIQDILDGYFPYELKDRCVKAT